MTAVPQTPFPRSTVLGYPRIGPRRELKHALEAYWAGKSSLDELDATGHALREQTWLRLRSLGLAAVPSGTFSRYDQVLDTVVLLDAVPDRYRSASSADSYFAMARGTAGTPPLRMTKWFDTNYHYLVPEIDAGSPFRLVADQQLAEVRQARELGISTRPVVIGPITFLLLSQPAAGSPAAFTPLDRLDDVLVVYGQLLAALAAEGVEWVQLDEPALVADRSPAELAAAGHAYRYLSALTERPQLFVASYFGELGGALPALAGTAVEAIGLDLVDGSLPADLSALAGKTVVAGVVAGRDVWRTDPAAARQLLARLRELHTGPVVVSTSCSLLHVPYDLDAEDQLDDRLRSRLAFAQQKVAEVVALAEDSPTPVTDPTGPAPTRPARTFSSGARSPYPVRAAAQADHLGLPALAVTTIGSFPQTAALRAARAALAAGTLRAEQYDQQVRDEIEQVIRLQERLGLDVLVHGEPERNDMVQFFAERLDGFAVTRNGWVQSYGSRCTRPPILHDDVRRPAPMTVELARFAQSLTERPVKGMLTGPVTIVAWSFKRRDLPLAEVIWQVADAVREEVADLQEAGIAIIQVDEPALRELLPLRSAGRQAYLDSATGAYRHATSGAADRTQIHTHLCYSNAAEVLAAVDALDADVTTIESARSGAGILAEPEVAAFARGLGPGVYDIHSPRVPQPAEVRALIEATVRVLPAERVWVNPDCGLKTRDYDEVEAALTHLVAAAAEVRAQLSAPANA